MHILSIAHEVGGVSKSVDKLGLDRRASDREES